MANDDETIRFDIQISAEAAVTELKKVLQGAETVDQKVVLFSKHLMDMSRQWGVPWRNLLSDIRSVNAELSKQHKATLFGNVGGQPVFDLSKQFLESAEAGNRFVSTSNSMTNATKGFNGEVVKAKDGVTALNKGLDDAEKSSGRAVRGLDAVRIALGAIVAMIVFRAIQAVQDFFTKSIETAKEFETSLYRLQNVEKILSQSGVETSVQGLLNIVKEVKKQFPIFSEADITQQISLIGIMTKEFGLTEQQILGVANAIGVMNIRSAGTEDLLTTTNKVLTAMVAPAGKGIATLGVAFDEDAIKAMALKTGLLQAGDAFTKLTAHDKDMLKVALLLENTGEELKTIKEFLKTNTGALAEQGAVWEDTLRMAGQAFLALKASAAPVIIEILKYLQEAINATKAFIVITEALRNVFTVLFGMAQSFFTNPFKFIKDFDASKWGELIVKAFTDSMREGFAKFFTGIVPEGAPQWFKDLFGSYVSNADEATGSTDNLTESLNAMGDALDKIDFGDLVKDMADLQNDMAKAEADFQEKMQREAEDFNLSQQRAYEDYQKNAREALEDFNRKRHDAEQEYRDREAEAEAKFQEKMRQLRAKYLFDLEDALRERDAGQVLRLMRQYQMDKTNAINEEAIRKKFAEKQHTEDRERAKQELQDKLDDLAEEYRIKNERAIEDYNIKVQREQEEHAQDMADLRARMDERLMLFAEKAAEELGLKEDGAQKIYEALQAYYGPGGKFDGLYDYSIESAAARAVALRDMLAAIAQQMQAISMLGQAYNGNPSYIPSGGLGGATRPTDLGKQAKGGTYLATRPTKVIFGDNGPEIGSFIPLGSGSSKAFSSASGVGGAMGSGRLDIQLLLSPDLEARVMDNTMDAMANVFVHVQRSK